MEIRKNRNKIKIAVLFLVLLVVEIVCMYLINSRNIRIISMSGKDNYESGIIILHLSLRTVKIREIIWK